MDTNNTIRNRWRFMALALVAALLLGSCACNASKGTGGRNGLSGATISSLEDLSHVRLATMLGTTQDFFLHANYPDSQILLFNNATDVVTALTSNQCDAIVMETLSMNPFLEKNRDLYVLEPNLFEGQIGFGFLDEELRGPFNQFLSSIAADGTLKSVLDSWNGKSELPQIPENTVDASVKTIRVGITGTDLPFSVMADGKASGMDIDLLTRFANSASLNIEFSVMDFAALIPALVSGKVDVICGGITITEERAKKVLFSDPYFSSATSVIIKRPTENIGVLMGSSQDVFATESYPNATLTRLDHASDLLLALEQGQCDGIIVDEASANYMVEVVPTVEISEKNLMQNTFSVGFSKPFAHYIPQFNAFVQALRDDGTYDQMVERWIVHAQKGVMPEFDFSNATGTLRFGTSAASVPFSYYKENQVVGFDVEMIYRFAQQLNLKPELIVHNFSGMLAAIISSSVDIAANSIMVTDERAKVIDFSLPYYNSNAVMLVRKQKEEKGAVHYVLQNDGSDLASSSVGAMVGSTGEQFLAANYKEADIQLFDDIIDAITALRSNKLKYVLTSFTTAKTVAKTDSSLALLPKEYMAEAACIALKKGNDALREKVNVALQQLKDAGKLEDMIQRWINEPTSNYKQEEVPVVEDGPVLRVGVAANREPMCFVSNGNVVGLDSELIRRIAYAIGMKVEFVDMKFSSLIPALISEKIDVICSNMTATQERRKTVAFSDDYFVNPQILMTRQIEVETVGKEKSSWWNRLKDSYHNNLVVENRYKLLWNGFKVTFLIALLASILGTILGALVCALRMSRSWLLREVAKVYIGLLRGIPQVVLLMVMFYIVFAKVDVNGIAVAVITFAMNFAAYTSEMFRTSIMSIDKGQTEAGIALGFSKIKTFMVIILPQAFQRVLPVYKGEFISLVKMTSIVGYIAVQDLTKAGDIIRSRTFDAFFPLILVAIIYFVLSWILVRLLSMLELRAMPKRRG